MTKLRDRTTEPLDRFLLSFTKEDNGCWIWNRGTSDGYGVMQVGGARIRAHRFSYSEFVGPIVDEAHVLHKCDRPLCVNPNHLFLGDQVSNMADMVAKGRANKGEDRPAAKLTEEAVRFIRANYKRGHKTYGATALAQKYGVDYYTVYAVIEGKAWRHVK